MEALSSLTVKTGSVHETQALGARLGALLEEGDFIGLEGELGAGKTQFVKGLARGLGVDDADVSSPTFAIVQSYAGRITLHHADLYRLESEADLYATGFFDLLEHDSVAVVEWISKFPDVPPDDWLLVQLAATAGDDREIRFSAMGPRAQHRLAALKEAIG